MKIKKYKDFFSFYKYKHFYLIYTIKKKKNTIIINFLFKKRKMAF